MKNFNLSQFLGCCVISIGIIIAGQSIGKELPETTQVPSNIMVTTSSEEKTFGSYISYGEVADYLGVTWDDINRLFDAGEFIGTYTKIGETIVFSRDKLDEWVKKRME